MSADWNNLFATWYMWLGSLNAALAQLIRAFSDGLGVPLLSAFLLGVPSTTVPCHLSTNVACVAPIARCGGRQAWRWSCLSCTTHLSAGSYKC